MSEQLEIPQKCSECPVVEGVHTELAVADFAKQSKEMSADYMMNSTDLEAYVDVFIETQGLDPNRKEAYMRLVRREMAMEIDDLDAHAFGRDIEQDLVLELRE